MTITLPFRTLVKRLSASLRRRRAPQTLAVFVPNGEGHPFDPVELLHGWVSSSAQFSGWIYRLEAAGAALQAVVDGRVQDAARRVAIFGHPCPWHQQLRAPGGHFFGPIWWRLNSGRRWPLTLVHVCSGALVFGRASWREIFPDWVSYREDLFLFLGTDRGQELWEKVSLRLLEALEGASSPEDLRSRVEGVYESATASTLGTLDVPGGDILNLLYFEHAMNGLVTSQALSEE